MVVDSRAACCGLVLLIVTTPAPALEHFPAAPLTLEVVDDQGARLGGVEVRVEGLDRDEALLTPWNGDLALELPPGTFDLRLALDDYYELVIRGVEIPVDAEAGSSSAPSGQLRVMMIREVHFEKDLVILESTYVEAPPLEITFQPTNAVENQKAQGVVTITNIGDDTLLLPLGREFRRTPRTLLMRIQVEVEDSDVWYDQPFVCEPSKNNCHELQPGESVAVPIKLQSRASYGRPEWVAARWDAEGEVLDGSVRAYLVYPEVEEDPERRGAYTHKVEASFQLTVSPDPLEAKP